MASKITRSISKKWNKLLTTTPGHEQEHAQQHSQQPEATPVSDTSSDETSSEDEHQQEQEHEHEPDAAVSQEDGRNNTDLPFHPRRVPRRSSLKKTPTETHAAATATADADSDQDDEEDPLSPYNNEVMVPGRRGSVKRQRPIVMFNEEVNVRQVVPAKCLSNEPESLWFQDEEYTSIKQKTMALISKVDANGILNGKKYCTRGLERYMMCPIEREGNKFEAWDSVLLEQRLQREEGTFCDEAIARLYKCTTTKSIADATHQARLDALEVASFYYQSPVCGGGKSSKSCSSSNYRMMRSGDPTPVRPHRPRRASAA